MRRPSCRAADRLFAAVLLAVSIWSPAIAEDRLAGASADGAVDLQLEVLVNGRPTGLIAAFRMHEGKLEIQKVQLENCGIRAPTGIRSPDEWVDISTLSDVSYAYVEQKQSIEFTATTAALAVHRLNTEAAEAPRRENLQASTGALVNYTLYGAGGATSTGRDLAFEGLSGAFDARFFGSWGLLSSSQTMAFSQNDIYSSARLDTTWTYSDPNAMVTYAVGDLISGGLSYTRPVRLGGIQIQRNFGLRPDLVTMPLPEIRGTAAVPSTVDLYVNDVQHSSHAVPAGEFSIADIPAVGTDGLARLVVRDALGRETVTESSLFASSALLAPGLFDYSAEIGFARRNYGIGSFDYDGEIAGIATARYGLSPNLTMHGHVEVTPALLNGGIGTTFALGSRGTASAAIAGSTFEERTGFLLSGGVEMQLWAMNLRINSQHTFGDYNDIASVTSERSSVRAITSAAPAKALDQLNLSFPLGFDETTLNFNLTRVTTAADRHSTIFGVTASRSIGERGNVFVTAYKDASRPKAYGVFAGLSWSFGNNAVSTSLASDQDGYTLSADVIGTRSRPDGDFDWRLSATQGVRERRSASASYETSSGRAEGHVEQSDDRMQVRGEVEGAIVIAGGDVFVSDRIEDAFAVVDAGVAGVPVEYENRPIGKTGRRGKILISGLRSHEENRLAISPSELPVDVAFDSTSETIVPRKGSGVVVRFGGSAAQKGRLLTLVTKDGEVVEAGSLVSVNGTDETAIVGYDGHSYVNGLTGKTVLTVQQPAAGTCEAEFDPRGEARQPATAPVLVCRRIQ